ncbi:MAG: hypothetical protein ACYC0X_15650 [Pirellulaceae bacterium]
MSSLSSDQRLPVEETWASKHDNIDWTVIASQPCDLEFRPDDDLALPSYSAIVVQAIAQLSFASLFAWLLVYPIATWITPKVNGIGIGVLAVVAGVVVAARTTLRLSGQGDGRLSALLCPRTLRGFLLPPLLWQAVAGLEHVHHLAGAVSYYFFVSLPLAIIAFDRFATHAVRWCTASPTAHHAKMEWGRRVWSRRLLVLSTASNDGCAETGTIGDTDSRSVERGCSSYRWGPAWAYGAAIAPLVLHVAVLRNAPAAVQGVQVLFGLTFSTLAALIVRGQGDVRLIPGFLRMLAHWFFYGWHEQLPRWVFQSPCGDCLRRQAYFLVVAAILAVPMTSLTAHSSARLLAAAPGQGMSADTTYLPPDATNPFLCLTLAADNPRSTLWIGPTVVAALAVVPLHFCLLGLLLTGNLISIYRRVFDAPLKTPPPPTFPDDNVTISTPLQGDLRT